MRCLVLLSAWCVAAATVGTPGTTVAGGVSGRIAGAPRPATAPTADLYGKYGEAAPTAPGVERFTAVVALVPTEGKSPLLPRPMPTMNQEGIEFVPHLLPIQTGSRVRFLNSDPVFHNVFSLSPAKRFDLGRYPRGESRVLSFDKPGVVKVFCDIHTSMLAYIVVVDTPYYVVTEPGGLFEIGDVPRGAYEVIAWGEGLNHFATLGRVEVPESGSVPFSADLARIR